MIRRSSNDGLQWDAAALNGSVPDADIVGALAECDVDPIAGQWGPQPAQSPGKTAAEAALDGHRAIAYIRGFPGLSGTAAKTTQVL
jgi:hypothetical protein